MNLCFNGLVKNLGEKLLHFLTPRHTNNHRAKALHLSSISTYIVLLLLFQGILTGVAKFKPEILGYATNITVTDLLNDTNAERAKNGASPLTLNDKLTAAAQAKAADMFVHQYWAHTSPQGRDPWSFITAAGYNYLYAGENLARDFADSASVVQAWMNSPSHRENLVNPRYLEVGFAVVNGKYNNYETTLVVQMFGTRQGATPTVVAPETPSVVTLPELPENPQTDGTRSSGMILNTNNNTVIPPSAGSGLKLDIFQLTKAVSLVLTVFLIFVLGTDMVLVYKRKTVRISGHSLAHMMLFIVLLIVLNLVGRGVVL